MNVNIGNDEYRYRIYRTNMNIIDMNMSETSININASTYSSTIMIVNLNQHK